MTCAECGTEFQSKWSDARFCTVKCQKRYHDRLRRKGKRSLATRACVECGETFQPGRINARFCRAECRHKHGRRRLKG